MKYTGRVLVPEDDTHIQTITDVYKIFKTSYSKCYDSEEEMFFCDVVHHLEQHSASTKSETDSLNKYRVENNSLKEAIENVPKWLTSLPKNYGVNVSVSLSYKEGEPQSSPLHYIEDMGIEMIEYVKLKIGYNFLKSNLSKASEERYNKTICPGLTGGAEDPIVLRMLYMQYINSEDYLKWVLRSRKKMDERKNANKTRSEDSVALKTVKSDSVWKSTIRDNVSPLNQSTKEEDLKNISLESQFSAEKSFKEELPPLNPNEKQHIIMLTQYEVIDQELPDDIEVFWPGKRDYENDFNNFKNALSENILHRHFIQKFKSGKLERLDDTVWLECKDYFLETMAFDEEKPTEVVSAETAETETKPTRTGSSCNWNDLKERFRDYTISQEATLALFDNIHKEKNRLENLNLCCIISKLKEIHRENPEEGGNDGELIWRDMVIVKSRSDESEIPEEVIQTVCEEEKPEEDLNESLSSDNDIIDYSALPEYKSLIYISKVYPDQGLPYMEDKCLNECAPEGGFDVENGLKGGCTGYSMSDYRAPFRPQCGYSVSGQLQIKTGSKGAIPSRSISKQSVLPRKESYVTFHTDWSNYPYSEMLDVVFHRHHLGYIYMTDVFEIKPDTLREINRIFHKTGKWSEKESPKWAISAYNCSDPRPRPPCCSQEYADEDVEGSPFIPFLPPTSLGQDRATTVKRDFKYFQDSHTHQNDDSISTCFPNMLDIERMHVENLQIERDPNYNLTDSQTSSEELDNSLDRAHFLERFKSPEISSVDFESHDENGEEYLCTHYPVCIDYVDKTISNAKKISLDEDEYSDIVDFIKNFRFGEEQIKIPTNYEKDSPIENNEEQEVFVDLLPQEREPTCTAQVTQKQICEDWSVNSNDSLSLKDVKGLTGDLEGCCRPKEKDRSSLNLAEISQAPRVEHKVTGELYDAIFYKRRSVLQELRTSFPLIYLYFDLKTHFSKLNSSGKLNKYKKVFQGINNEYQAILIKHDIKIDNKSKNVKDFVKHRHILYDEIFGKYKSFDVETRSMALGDGFIRHLIIREAFQDIGTNLSFFLLQFIENDRFNLLYSENKKDSMNYKQIIMDVCNFLNRYRKDKAYKKFLLDVVVIHYFNTKKYFNLEELIEKDSHWEEIFRKPRTIKVKEENNVEINITLKDSDLQSCSGYSYVFYRLIKQFNQEYQENQYFRKLLEPELNPKSIIHIDCIQMNTLILKDCLELCETSLLDEVEADITAIMRTVWKCEILGFNQCQLSKSNLCNRFPNETINYFTSFFPTIISKVDEKSTLFNNFWRYNRKFHFWFDESGKTADENMFLCKNNLFTFEKLLTKCLLRSIITYYDYIFHG